MAYQLKDINAAVRRDPVGFMEECDAHFLNKVSAAADRIADNRKNSPVVLLSGPSGSGKTTVAGMLERELNRRGVRTHAVSMDDYYTRPEPGKMPLTPEGELDLESPELLDLALLDEHFTRLAEGKWILVPHYEFARGMRNDSKGRVLRVDRDEVVIFEGIHALNARITSRHPEAARLYISARSDVEKEGDVVFKRTWIRLTRRAVRDYNFRGTDICGTLKLWDNVRRGEKLYISPFKGSAHVIFDSSLPYEVPVMACYAGPMLEALPEENRRLHELRELIAAFVRFEPIDPELVPRGSLLREFIG